MCLLRDVGKQSCLVGRASHFVMYSVLSITTSATPASAVTIIWPLSFLEMFKC